MMESYRIVNRELSINNQELRIALNRLKHEITYLNNQLIEQRKQFYNLKESIANTLEKKHCETMAALFPERTFQKESLIRTDVRSHRRSCENVTSTDALRTRTRSPPVTSPKRDLMVDANMKTPIPKVIVQRDARISKSLLENETEQGDSQNISDGHSQCSDHYSQNSTHRHSGNISENLSQASSELQHSVENKLGIRSSLSQSMCSFSNSLQTISEELTNEDDTRNETITDATINNLLDAPCSTPYNRNKIADSNITTKEMRILVRKLSVDKIEMLKKTSSGSNISDLNFTECNSTDFTIPRKESTFLKVNTCHLSARRKPFTQIHNDSSKTNSPKKVIEKKIVVKTNKSQDKNQNSLKENNGIESEFSSSEGESVRKCLRPKRIQTVCLKEPSLRQKLRNTTNLKLK